LCQNDGLAWRGIETGDRRGFVGLAHEYGTGLGRYENFAVDDGESSFLPRRQDFAGDASTADTDGRDRGGHRHLRIVGFRDLSTDENKHAFQHGERRTTRFGCRIIDKLVQRQPRFRAERKGCVINENEIDGAAARRLNNVALEYGITRGQLHARAVHPHGERAAG
jgi:hypothetical protein